MAESVFVGNLVAEPEIRDTREGKPWASFTLVHSDRVKDQSGNWVDGDATFLDCVMFAHGAGNLAGLVKGTRLVAAGRLKQQNWEKEGQKRSKIQLVADEVAVSAKFGRVTFQQAAQQGYSASQPSNAGVSSEGWANPAQNAFNNERPF